jgi:hypothetical protein
VNPSKDPSNGSLSVSLDDIRLDSFISNKDFKSHYSFVEVVFASDCGVKDIHGFHGVGSPKTTAIQSMSTR